MKKFQNNFTTTEQSKRLLELGVPADSADCFWFDERDLMFLKDELYSDEAKDGEWVRATDYLPCWSVGRLIEIYLLCAELKKPQMIFIKEDVLMMDRMINELCYMAESERLDFSKLEE